MSNKLDLSYARNRPQTQPRDRTPVKNNRQKGESMNPEQRLNDVAVQMVATAGKTVGKIHVVREGLNIIVIGSAVRTVPCLPIASYEAEEVKKGLTPTEWVSLSRKLEKAAKEIAKCSEQSKP